MIYLILLVFLIYYCFYNNTYEQMTNINNCKVKCKKFSKNMKNAITTISNVESIKDILKQTKIFDKNKSNLDKCLIQQAKCILNFMVFILLIILTILPGKYLVHLFALSFPSTRLPISLL